MRMTMTRRYVDDRILRLLLEQWKEGGVEVDVEVEGGGRRLRWSHLLRFWWNYGGWSC